MPIVRTSPKGQVVVSVEIRKAIGLEPGGLVMVTHAGDRRVMIEPVADDPVDAVRGLLRDGPSLTDALKGERKDEDAQDEEKAARLIRAPHASERRGRGGRGR